MPLSNGFNFTFHFIFRIEHLEPDILNAMPDVIFGQLSPKVVIMTTPNIEFNVLFPGLKGFRHYDHKFEWTRAEFEEWLVFVVLPNFTQLKLTQLNSTHIN